MPVAIVTGGSKGFGLALATDLAYYALNGSLPAGVTSLPAAVGPTYTCSGSPS